MPDWAGHLARYRVPLGFVFGAAALWLARPTWPRLALGAAVAMCGEAFRVWASGHLKKGREVTQSGPYRLTRHPLYVGSSVIGVGLVIAAAHIVVAILVAVYLGIIVTAAIRTEEAVLRERFGDEYTKYRDSVTSASSSRPFTIASAIQNREHRAIAGLLLAVALLALKIRWLSR